MQSKSLFSTIALAIFGVTLSAQSVTQGTVTVNLPEGWVQDTESIYCLRIVSPDGSCDIQVYDFGGVSGESAAHSITDAIESNGVDLLNITTSSFETKKIARREYTLQSNTQNAPDDESRQQWWAAYSAEINGSQILIYGDQFFNTDGGEANLTKTVEAVIKSLKLD